MARRRPSARPAQCRRHLHGGGNRSAGAPGLSRRCPVAADCRLRFRARYGPCARNDRLRAGAFMAVLSKAGDRGMKRFDQKKILVTGGAGAIGSAAVRRFLDEGARVAIVDRDGAAAHELARALGDNTIAIEADVTDETNVRNAVEKTVETFGGLDVVFNNAGISGVVAPVHELPVEDWDTIIRVN